MKVQKKGNDDERRVVLGMILSDEVAGRISTKMETEEGEGPFRSRWANLIAGWCKDYYQRYDKAPGQAVEGLFRQWAEANQSEEKTLSLVERFLEALDDETEGYDINSKFTIDLAGQLFNKVKLERHVETIQGEMDSGRTSKAIARAEEFHRLEIGEGEGVDVFLDKEAVRAAFAEESKSLITYPGPLGVFFGDRLKRDSLISFMAPEKRGKSWWLIDLSWRAMLQRRKVAFFAVGDMGQDEMIQRLMIRSSSCPEKACIVKVPSRIESVGDGGVPSIDFNEKKFSTDLNWQKAWLSCKKTVTQRVRSKESFFRLSVHPADSISVDGLSSIVKGWNRDGWVPDVIVIDYADLLAPPSGNKMDYRHQIDATWKRLRALANSLDCLIVTATQSDASSYDVGTLSKKHFSEDKRKMAHVNGMIGINQTPDEEDAGIYRLNWIVARRGKNKSHKCIYTAGCLDLGNPAVRSCW